jgi:Secretion system C-terminal sorting domain/Polysaccharide deacetylase
MMKAGYLPLLLSMTLNLVQAQKVTIFFDSASSTTPSVSKAALRYDKDFAYSFTLDDGTADAFTHAFPLLQGGVIKDFESAFSPLYYTDGCGNDIVFKAGIAWNSANSQGVDTHTGDVKGYLTWGQLDTLYNAGWDVFNHSFSHKSQWIAPMSTSDYANEILRNQLAVREKTAKKLEMPVFVVPSGDAGYQDIALQLGNKVVFDQSGNVSGMGGLQVDDNLNLTGQKIHRQNIVESLSWMNQLEKVVEKSRNGGHYWYNEFAHRVNIFEFSSFNFFSFKNQMEKIANNWGKKGTDQVWMAPLQEVFEYLVLRQTAQFKTTVSNQKMDIQFDLSQVPTWLRRKTLTIKINATNNFSRVEASTGIKKTFRGSGNSKIINLDFTEYFKLTNTKESTDVLDWRVYPNPTHDFITIELLDHPVTSADFTISDASGKMYVSARFSGSTFQQDIKAFPSGIYFLNIKLNNKSTTTKFIKI